MGFFSKFFSNEPNYVIIVKSKIEFENSNELSTNFFDHHEKFQSAEYIRLVMHYYAKMLCNFDPADSTDKNLISLLKSNVENLELKKGKMIFDNLDNDAKDILQNLDKNQNSNIIAELCFLNMENRGIKTYFSKSVNSTFGFGSFFSLLQKVIDKIEQNEVNELNIGLKNMNNLYKTGYDCSDVRHLTEVPNKAFWQMIYG